MPAAGQIAHGSEAWAEPAGGGGVAAVQIAKLAGACDFFTALGEDELGRRSAERFEELGVTLHAQWFGRTRRALTHVDRNRERTITTVGPKLRPMGPLPLAGLRRDLLRRRRRGRAPLGARGAVPLGDAARARDPARGRRAARPARRQQHRSRRGLRGRARRRSVRRDRGLAGGVAGGVRFEAVPPPGPIEDTYGAGDSFAATLTFALARGDALPDALNSPRARARPSSRAKGRTRRRSRRNAVFPTSSRGSHGGQASPGRIEGGSTRRLGPPTSRACRPGTWLPDSAASVQPLPGRTPAH